MSRCCSVQRAAGRTRWSQQPPVAWRREGHGWNWAFETPKVGSYGVSVNMKRARPSRPVASSDSEGLRHEQHASARRDGKPQIARRGGHDLEVIRLAIAHLLNRGTHGRLVRWEGHPVLCD